MKKMLMVLVEILIFAGPGCKPVVASKNEIVASKATIDHLNVQMKDVIPEKEYSGGWGYDKDSAVIIATGNEMTGVALERSFLRRRSWHEVMAAIENKKVDGKVDDIEVISPKMKAQGLVSIGDKSYDRIQYEVYVELASGANFTYDAECWFDITSFFGK